MFLKMFVVVMSCMGMGMGKIETHNTHTLISKQIFIEPTFY